MKEQTMATVVCPLCKGLLRFHQDQSCLECGSCKVSYLVVDGIPIFINDAVFEKYNTELKLQDLDEEQSFYEQMYSDLNGLDDGHCVVAGYDELYRFMEGIDHGTLLDVGCGAGHHSKDLSAMGFQVTGIDISMNGLRQARSVTTAVGQDVEFMLADIENLPFEDNSFDVVFCGLILHHFPRRSKLIRELNRVCRSHFIAFEVNAYDPVSFLRFDVINPTIGIPSITRNQRTVSPFRLAKELEQAGFATIRYEFLDVHHYLGRYPQSLKAKILKLLKGITQLLPVQYRNNKFMLKASRVAVG